MSKAHTTLANVPEPREGLARLASASLYLCTDARRDAGDLAAFADAALAGGVDIIQLREKGLEARDELAALGEVGCWELLGPAWGPFAESTWIDLFVHAVDEVVHHGAEIGLLRDLYPRLTTEP